MKKSVLQSQFLVAIIFLLVTFFVSTASEAADDKVTIRYASGWPATHSTSKQIVEWQKRITDLTKGAVAFQNYWGGSLVKMKETIPAVKNGIADLGLGLSVYAPSYLPLSSVTDVPFITKNSYAQLNACKELFKTFKPFRDEYEKNNLVPVVWIASEPSLLGSKEEIAKLSDIKGKKIRVTGYLSQVISAVGASPIALSGSQVYEALERGTIDGYTGANLRYAAAMKFYEAAKYFVDPGFGTYVTINLVMNKKIWNKLSAESKEAFETASSEFETAQIEFMNQANIKNAHAFIDNGAIPLVWSKEDLEKIKKIGSPVVETAWIASLKKRELPAEEMLSQYKNLVEKYETNSPYKDSFKMCIELYKQRKK